MTARGGVVRLFFAVIALLPFRVTPDNVIALTRLSSDASVSASATSITSDFTVSLPFVTASFGQPASGALLASSGTPSGAALLLATSASASTRASQGLGVLFISPEGGYADISSGWSDALGGVLAAGSPPGVGGASSACVDNGGSLWLLPAAAGSPPSRIDGMSRIEMQLRPLPVAGAVARKCALVGQRVLVSFDVPGFAQSGVASVNLADASAAAAAGGASPPAWSIVASAPQEGARGFAVSPDGGNLFLAFSGGVVLSLSWSAAVGEFLPTAAPALMCASSVGGLTDTATNLYADVAVSPDGARLYVAAPRAVLGFDVLTGECRGALLTAPPNAVFVSINVPAASDVTLVAALPPSESNTPSATPSITPSISLSPKETPTATGTPLSTGTGTPTSSRSRTSSPTRSRTRTPSVSGTASRSPTVSGTASRTMTAPTTPSTTLSASGTPSTTLSASGTPSTTLSASSTPSTTQSGSGTPSTTQSESGTPSTTVSLSATSSTTPSATPTSTVSLSGTPVATSSATASPSSTPSATPSVSPAETPSTTSAPTGSDSQTPTGTASPSASDTGSTTRSHSVSPTMTGTPVGTGSSTPSPTGSDSATGTDSASFSPSASGSVTGSDSSTGTPSMTASPTPSQTGSRSVSATPTVTTSRTSQGTPSGTPLLTTSQTPPVTPSRSPSQSVSPTAAVTPTNTLSLGASLTRSPSVSPTSPVTPPSTVSPTKSASSTPPSTLSSSGSPTLSLSGSATPAPTPPVSPATTPSVSATRSRTPSTTSTPSLTPSTTASSTPPTTPSHTVSPSRSRTASPTPTITASTSSTGSPSGQSTRTASYSPVQTPPMSPTPTLTTRGTASPTGTPANTPSSTETLSQSPSQSGTAAATPSVSSTSTVPATPSGSGTGSLSLSPTVSDSSTATPTTSQTPASTPTATLPPTPPATPQMTPTMTPSPSSTPPATPAATPSTTPPSTPAATPPTTPSQTPSTTPSRTTSVSPSSTPPSTPSSTLSASSTPPLTPTRTPLATPSSSPPVTPTGSSTASESGTPPATPSQTPSVSPTRTTSTSSSPTPSSSPSTTPAPTPSPAAPLALTPAAVARLLDLFLVPRFTGAALVKDLIASSSGDASAATRVAAAPVATNAFAGGANAGPFSVAASAIGRTPAVLSAAIATDAVGGGAVADMMPSLPSPSMAPPCARVIDSTAPLAVTSTLWVAAGASAIAAGWSGAAKADWTGTSWVARVTLSASAETVASWANREAALADQSAAGVADIAAALGASAILSLSINVTLSPLGATSAVSWLVTGATAASPHTFTVTAPPSAPLIVAANRLLPGAAYFFAPTLATIVWDFAGEASSAIFLRSVGGGASSPVVGVSAGGMPSSSSALTGAVAPGLLAFTHSPFSGGAVQVAPLQGTSAVTNFTITSDAWVDVDAAALSGVTSANARTGAIVAASGSGVACSHVSARAAAAALALSIPSLCSAANADANAVVSASVSTLAPPRIPKKPLSVSYSPCGLGGSVLGAASSAPPFHLHSTLSSRDASANGSFSICADAIDAWGVRSRAGSSAVVHVAVLGGMIASDIAAAVAPVFAAAATNPWAAAAASRDGAVALGALGVASNATAAASIVGVAVKLVDGAAAAARAFYALSAPAGTLDGPLADAAFALSSAGAVVGAAAGGAGADVAGALSTAVAVGVKAAADAAAGADTTVETVATPSSSLIDALADALAGVAAGGGDGSLEFADALSSLARLALRGASVGDAPIVISGFPNDAGGGRRASASKGSAGFSLTAARVSTSAGAGGAHVTYAADGASAQATLPLLSALVSNASSPVAGADAVDVTLVSWAAESAASSRARRGYDWSLDAGVASVFLRRSGSADTGHIPRGTGGALSFLISPPRVGSARVATAALIRDGGATRDAPLFSRFRCPAKNATLGDGVHVDLVRGGADVDVLTAPGFKSTVGRVISVNASALRGLPAAFVSAGLVGSSDALLPILQSTFGVVGADLAMGGALSSVLPRSFSGPVGATDAAAKLGPIISLAVPCGGMRGAPMAEWVCSPDAAGDLVAVPCAPLTPALSCAWWDRDALAWSAAGCAPIDGVDASARGSGEAVGVCACDHLSDFSARWTAVVDAASVVGSALVAPSANARGGAARLIVAVAAGAVLLGLAVAAAVGLYVADARDGVRFRSALIKDAEVRVLAALAAASGGRRVIIDRTLDGPARAAAESAHAARVADESATLETARLNGGADAALLAAAKMDSVTRASARVRARAAARVAAHIANGARRLTRFGFSLSEGVALQELLVGGATHAAAAPQVSAPNIAPPPVPDAVSALIYLRLEQAVGGARVTAAELGRSAAARLLAAGGGASGDADVLATPSDALAHPTIALAAVSAISGGSDGGNTVTAVAPPSPPPASTESPSRALNAKSGSDSSGQSPTRAQPKMRPKGPRRGVSLAEVSGGTSTPGSSMASPSDDVDSGGGGDGEVAAAERAAARERELELVRALAAAAGGGRVRGRCLALRAAAAVSRARCATRHPIIYPVRIFDPRASRLARATLLVASIAVHLFFAVFFIALRAGAANSDYSDGSGERRIVWTWGASLAPLRVVDYLIAGAVAAFAAAPVDTALSWLFARAGDAEFSWRYPALSAELARRYATEAALEGVSDAALSRALVVSAAAAQNAPGARAGSSGAASTWDFGYTEPPALFQKFPCCARARFIRRARASEAAAASYAREMAAGDGAAFGGAVGAAIVSDGGDLWAALGSCDGALAAALAGAALARLVVRAFTSAIPRVVPRLRPRGVKGCPTATEDAPCDCATCKAQDARPLPLPVAAAPRLISCDSVCAVRAAVFRACGCRGGGGKSTIALRADTDASSPGCTLASACAFAAALTVTLFSVSYASAALLLATPDAATAFLSSWAASLLFYWAVAWPIGDAAKVASSLFCAPACAVVSASLCGTARARAFARASSGRALRSGAPGLGARLAQLLFVKARASASGLSAASAAAALTPLDTIAAALSAGDALTAMSSESAAVSPAPPAVTGAASLSSGKRPARAARPASARRVRAPSVSLSRGVALPSSLPFSPLPIFSIREESSRYTALRNDSVLGRAPLSEEDSSATELDGEDRVLIPSRQELMAQWYIRQRVAQETRVAWVARLRARAAALRSFGHTRAHGRAIENMADDVDSGDAADNDDGGDGGDEGGKYRGTAPSAQVSLSRPSTHPATRLQPGPKSPSRDAALRISASARAAITRSPPQNFAPAPLPYETPAEVVTPLDTPQLTLSRSATSDGLAERADALYIPGVLPAGRDALNDFDALSAALAVARPPIPLAVPAGGGTLGRTRVGLLRGGIAALSAAGGSPNDKRNGRPGSAAPMRSPPTTRRDDIKTPSPIV